MVYVLPVRAIGELKMKGSEAILTRSFFEGKECVVKNRALKKYRNEKLDIFLRKKRTKSEAKILKRLNDEKISAPKIYFFDDFSITMEFLHGARADENGKNIKEAGLILSKIHSIDIIHGDYTFANLMEAKGKIYVFDFGLGYFSSKIEDKAVDVFTMLLSLHDKKHKEIFLDSYFSSCKDSEKIKKRLDAISKRIRYS